MTRTLEPNQLYRALADELLHRLAELRTLSNSQFHRVAVCCCVRNIIFELVRERNYLEPYTLLTLLLN
jgi:hypothetical protein